VRRWRAKFNCWSPRSDEVGASAQPEHFQLQAGDQVVEFSKAHGQKVGGIVSLEFIHPVAVSLVNFGKDELLQLNEHSMVVCIMGARFLLGRGQRGF